MHRNPLALSLIAGTTLALTGAATADVSHWRCADGDYWNSSCWDDGIPTDQGEGGTIDWDNFGTPYTVTFSGGVGVATMSLAHPDARWYMEDSTFNPAFSFTVGQGSLMTSVNSEFVGQSGVYNNAGTSVFQDDNYVDLQDIVNDDVMIVRGGRFLQDKTMTVQNGITNHATLSLENATSPNAASVRLDLLDGVLSNTGIVYLNTATTFDEAHLGADFDNFGAIVAYEEAFIDKPGGVHLNDSAIEARDDAALTIIDAAMLRNTGSMTALGAGSTLGLTRSLVDNTGGLILAQGEGSRVSLIDEAVVRGGTLRTVGTGRITAERDLFDRTPQVIESLTLDGDFDLHPDSRLVVRGAIENLGRFNLGSPNAGSNTRLRVDADATISGGEIVTEDWDFLSGNLTNYIDADGEHTLTLDGTFVHGVMRVGDDVLGIVNRGVVASDDPDPQGRGRVIVDPSDTLGFDNTGGQLLARNGATLELEDGPFLNDGSEIVAEDASLVEIRGPEILGGTLRTEGSGLMIVLSLQTPTLDNVALAGSLEIRSNANVRIVGTLDNTRGVVSLPDSGVFPGTSLSIDADATIRGGAILLSDDTRNLLVSADGAPHTLTLDGVDLTGVGTLGDGALGIVSTGNVTIDGDSEARIEVDDALGFDNRGTLRVAADAYLNARQGPIVSTGSLLVDEGGLMVKSGGDILIDAGEFVVAGRHDNAADITVRAGAAMRVSGTVRNGGDIIVQNSVLTMEGGTIEGSASLDNGLVEGVGSILSIVSVPSGRIEPAGTQVGTLGVGFPFTSGTGVLAFDIGGTTPGVDHDQLLVQRPIFQGGSLEVRLVDGFRPSPGDTFKIFDTIDGGLPIFVGDLPALDAPDISPLAWSLERVLLEDDDGDLFTIDVLLRATCPADFNGDGATNTLDVLAFLNAWSAGDPAADFNGDGAVNTLDVLAFLNAFTSGCA